MFQIQIPLLNIESGQERWYRLKDNALRKSADGEDPRILMEMKFYFNKYGTLSKLISDMKFMQHSGIFLFV